MSPLPPLYRALFALGFLPLFLEAGDNWPNFRGPMFDGSNPDAHDLPVEVTRTKGVAWRTILPGLGDSTPVVWGNSVFVTCEDSESDAVLALKLDIESGEIIWEHPFSESPRHDYRSSMAGASPTTDGERVIFPSGGGDLYCSDLDGNPIWVRNLPNEYGEFALKWTYSSSPILFEDRLYLQVLQRNESINGIPGRSSFLLALDPETGKEIWRQIRNTRAVGESMEAYSSPIPVNHQGSKRIVVAGADCITAHDPKNGRELWRWGTWNKKRKNHWRIVSSPVSGDGMIAACAPKGNPIYTFYAGSQGTNTPGDLKWKSPIEEVSCDVTSPLHYEKHFYILNGRKKILTCIEPYSGRIEWSESLPARARFEASPVAADGKIYIMSHTGEFFVYRASPKFQRLHATVLGNDPEARNRATVVPAQGRLLIRLGKELWCLKKSGDDSGAEKDR